MVNKICQKTLTDHFFVPKKNKSSEILRPKEQIICDTHCQWQVTKISALLLHMRVNATSRKLSQIIPLKSNYLLLTLRAQLGRTKREAPNHSQNLAGIIHPHNPCNFDDHWHHTFSFRDPARLAPQTSQKLTSSSTITLPNGRVRT